ncbi:MAG TPA: phosphotransferase [Acidobacteriota bacterium]|nr:phosphotransferase [Acidobacteriota bacterium]
MKPRSDSDFPPIQQRLMAFVRDRFGSRGDQYSISKLVGDASSRQYYRLVRENGESFILAAYPEPFNAREFPYKQVYDLLTEIGLPVPRMLALDGEHGIVLQQDLGDETLKKRLVKASPQERQAYFRRAIDHMVTLQEEGTRALRPHWTAYHLAFDEEKLRWELRFFKRYYVDHYRKLSLTQGVALEEEFDDLAQELSRRPLRLCHRDYHVRNLMLHEDRLFLIDFQDARRGPLTYDLVSLLKDSIDLPQTELSSLVSYYRSRSPQPVPEEDFLREFELMSVQRLLKALGTYAYQIVVRENFIYEQYVRGSLQRALRSVQALDSFPRIRDLLRSELD